MTMVNNKRVVPPTKDEPNRTIEGTKDAFV